MNNELSNAILACKCGEKSYFLFILNKMEPLIKKYTRLLYRDEREDVYQEFILSLLEAVNNIEYYETEGKCIYYLSKAIKNKFFELYRKSRNINDHETVLEDLQLKNQIIYSKEYENIIFDNYVEYLLKYENNKTKSILRASILFGISDIELSKKYNVSRQYIYKIRQKYYKKAKKDYTT